MQLPIQELTPAAFAAFGHVIAQPARTPDATGPGWQWWGEIAQLAADQRPFGVGYLDLRPAELRFDWAERHMRSPEMLIPAGGDCLVYVGPPEHLETPGRLPALDRFQAFRLRQGQAVVLNPGVWHGAPLAIDRPLNVVVLLLQGSGAAGTSLV
ncbi:MAG TPA: ureidoglycolate lyase, partial [Roseiflexaceae bacterium]|nr:ureidoglycolate lyase [Roseiflexaceae bacterium]